MLPVQCWSSSNTLAGNDSVCVCVTSVVLHACVVCDSLRPEAEAQDVSWVRTVSDQKGSVRFPLQLHLCILPVHRTPVPATLKRKPSKPSVPSDNRPSKCPRNPNTLQKHPLHHTGRSFTSSVLHQNLPPSITTDSSNEATQEVEGKQSFILNLCQNKYLMNLCFLFVYLFVCLST